MNADSLLTIQRMLGTIEGAIITVGDVAVMDAVLNAVQAIALNHLYGFGYVGKTGKLMCVCDRTGEHVQQAYCHKKCEDYYPMPKRKDERTV